MKRLSREHIVALHAQQVSAKGGLHGIRDETLLDAAIEAPYAAFGGIEFFPTLAEKAARLAFGLAANHPFNDGNKRIAVVSVLVLLGVNGVSVRCDDDELIALGLGLAAGEIDYEATLAWVRERIGEP